MDKVKTPYFISIDDDRIDNMICLKIIQHVLPEADVQTFTNPETGFEYIKSESVNNNERKGIIFLDINMPTLSGWELLDKCNNFPESAKKQIKIFMLSSSVSHKDKQMAENNSLVQGFIQKPLTTKRLQDILKEVEEYI